MKNDRKKMWAAAHPDRVRASRRRWVARNPVANAKSKGDYAKRNPDKVLAAKAAYRAKSKEKIAASAVSYKFRNLTKVKAYQTEYREKNKERVRNRTRAWARANAGKVTAYTRKHQTAKLRAMPAWANQFFIEEAYDLAQRRSAVTGFKWHGDHMVPLQGRTVCGLHCEFNLRVIPSSVNQKKSHVYWPDMP